MTPAPTQIERAEEAILELAKGALDATFRIELFPEDPDGFEFAGTARCALLQYRGSTYGESDGFDRNQERDVTFDLHLVYAASGAGEAYPHRPIKDIERLRLALQGAEVEGGHLRWKRDGLAEQQAGRRVYRAELGLVLTSVARTRPALQPIMNFERGAE